MALFPELKITIQGQSALADALSGSRLAFTDIVIGSGATTQDWAEMTDLVHREFNLGITERSRQDIRYFISSTLSNFEITIPAQFDLRELGVFATIADSEPFMFAYTNAGVNSSIVPASGSPYPYEKEFPIFLWVGNSASVTAIITVSNFSVFKINIPTLSWLPSTTYPDFGYQAEIALDLQPDDYIANIILNPSSVLAANSAEILAGGDVIGTTVRIYAKQCPSIDLSGHCIITREGN